MEKEAIHPFLQFLEEQKGKVPSVLILMHDYPDPDALGSAYALDHLLNRFFGISTKIVYGGIIGRMENRAMVRLLKIPVHKLKPSDIKKASHIALVDTQPHFKNNSFPKKRKAFLVIDQHELNEEVNAEFSLIDTECGATCVLLAQALHSLNIEIPTPVATALAYGILSDTQHLYRVKRKEIIQTYLDILPFADMQILAEIQNPSRSSDFFLTLSRGIKNALVRKSLIVSHLGEIHTPDFIAQIADLLLTHQGKKYSLCTGRLKGRLHVSLRFSSKVKVQASEILRDLFDDKGSAGGHGSIAGGSRKVGLNKNEEIWKNIEEELTQKLMKRLRLPFKGEFHAPFGKE